MTLKQITRSKEMGWGVGGGGWGVGGRENASIMYTSLHGQQEIY